jgi:nondiscriminating glutamyl-tRNA synthetase
MAGFRSVVIPAMESSDMHFDTSSQASPALVSFTAADVAAIVHERGWLAASRDADSADLHAWFGRAADLLGPHAADRASLVDLLALVFTYDAAAALRETENQSVLARAGAREVIRELANLVLDGGDCDSDRFKEIVDNTKSAVSYRSRDIFHPIRLALTGHVGGGELDRVILLLDTAARLDFAVPVKSTRQRMLEFCSALG